MTPRVLISTSSFGKADPAPLERLSASGIDYVLNPHGRLLSEQEIAELIREIDGLIAGTEPLSEAVLLRANRLRVIARVGIGLENVDLAAAERLRIPVYNTPDAVTDAVAELALGGILLLLRHIHVMDAELRAGRWEKRMGSLLRGKTVGIVGLGRIGKRLAQLLQPFEPRLLAAELAADESWAAAHGVAVVELDELLSAADIVTLHVSGVEGQLIGAGELAAMRPGAYLVNTARGSLVDEAALAAALEDGALAGAYVDTFQHEPYAGPLTALPNVLLTPHVGSYAREARARMELEAVEHVVAALADGR